MPTELEWAEAFKRLDSGESSYETEARRLGVGKGTVYRHHIAALQRRINVKKSELNRITDELSKAQQSLQTLIKERRRLEGEIGQAREKLSAVLQKLNQAISADEKFQRIGLEKLAQLAQFIESFEALGFDVETVRKLAEWKRALAVMGINLNTLEQYIKEKGPLEIELRKLKEKVERLEKLVETLEKAKAELLRSNASLSMLNKILGSRRINVPCKVCGQPIPIILDKKENYVKLINQGLGLNVFCWSCHRPSLVDVREIIMNVGWAVIP